MSRINRKPGTPEHVADYFRNSSDIQEASIERQRSSVEPFVKAQGWVVVEEIEDKDISGTEVAKRKGLQRLLALALDRKIDGIVVDDFDRLLRLDMLEMGELLAPLRRAGVWIHSVAQGRFDFHSMGGRLIMGVTSEAKRGEVMATARRCLTEHLRMARDLGQAPAPRTPYGYVRVEDMERPTNTRGKRYGKWIVHEERAEIVRQIFKWYIDGWATSAIARELNRRAVPTSQGGPAWMSPAVASILDNPAYVGDRAFGRRSTGKHFTLKEGKVTEVTQREPGRKKPIAECLLSTGTHPPIIDRETWEDAQKRKARFLQEAIDNDDGRVIRRNGPSTTPGGDKGKYLLTRLLVCGRCSHWMTGLEQGRTTRKRVYLCKHYTDCGLDGCVRCQVTEEQILPALFGKLRELLSADRQRWLRGRLRERLESRQVKEELPALRKLLKAEGDKLSRLRVRLGECSVDMLPEVEESIRSARARLAALQGELQRAEAANPVKDLETTVNAAAKALWRLEDGIQGECRLKLREALLGIVDHIKVFSEPREFPSGRNRYKASRIEVILRRGTGLDLLLDLDDNPAVVSRVLHISLSA